MIDLIARLDRKSDRECLADANRYLEELDRCEVNCAPSTKDSERNHIFHALAHATRTENGVHHVLNSMLQEIARARKAEARVVELERIIRRGDYSLA